jgi:hypothetical protein
MLLRRKAALVSGDVSVVIASFGHGLVAGVPVVHLCFEAFLSVVLQYKRNDTGDCVPNLDRNV